MGEVAKLTDLGGSYGLPVVGLQSDLQGVFLDNWPNADGSYQTHKIFHMWSDAELNNVGWARFGEVPINDRDLESAGTVDDFTAGQITRTHNTKLKPLAVLKTRKKSDVFNRRIDIASGGITFSSKPFSTSNDAMNEINLIFNALNAGESFPGGTIPWETLDNQILNANETQFLAFAKEVAQHRIKATKAAQAHITAINALSTKVAVAGYDITGDIVGNEWPVNP